MMPRREAMHQSETQTRHDLVWLAAVIARSVV
jgi:hypothetical protein